MEVCSHEQRSGAATFAELGALFVRPISMSETTTLPTVRLGHTGTQVTPLCLGMMTYGSKKWREWVLEIDEARPIVQRAVEAGINFYDTADMYSLGESEVITGKLLREFQPRREELVIATKVFNPMSASPNDRGLSRKHIMASIDASLKRLGVDYVDLYQIHRFDKNTPIEETCEALHDVVKAGKALYLGASSMYAWQFQRMLDFQAANGLARFVTMQNHYNLVYREEEREMIPLCLEQKIGCLPWSPLARGLLTGTRKRGDARSETVRARTDDYAHALYKDSDFDVVDRVIEMAAPAQRKARADRARLDSVEAGGERADHRRQQALPAGGRTRRATVEADRRRDQVAGSAVRAASCAGA